MTTKNLYFSFRVDESEKEKIERKIEKSKLKKSDYLRKTALEKNILVIENFKEFFIELKKQGNNLNQLTKAVHKGLIQDSGNLEELMQEYKKLNESISEVLRRF